MFLSWYERIVDSKEEYILFLKREIDENWNDPNKYQHFHNCIEFAFGIKGTPTVHIEDKVYTLGEGEVLYLDSFEPHSYDYSVGQVCYIVVISKSFFNSVNGLGTISFPTLMKNDEAFKEVKEFLDFSYKHWDESEMLFKRAFADTLAFLMKKYYPVVPKKVSDKQKEMPLKAIKYIAEHYAEDITVEELAKKYGYNSNYFSSIFNDYLGIGFREYLNACRIVEFKKLRLANSEITVSEAARMCGFKSMNTFYRAYKRTPIWED